MKNKGRELHCKIVIKLASVHLQRAQFEMKGLKAQARINHLRRDKIGHQYHTTGRKQNQSPKKRTKWNSSTVRPHLKPPIGPIKK